MTSENTDSVAVGTIKAHGLSVGDRFDFHGLATTDSLPAMEGTRVELGKVGSKYIITTVTGEIMTWEFGPSAKIYADTSVAHYVTTEARTLDNGDTVYVGTCEHRWTTGFHLTEDDARVVATGHGEVSRPLYVPTCVCDEIIASGPSPVERECPCGSVYPAMVAETAEAEADTVDIPTPAEVDALKAEHDAAMGAWAAPLLAVIAPSAGVSHVGSEVAEAEVWAGTDTMITYPLSRPNQTKMRRRARKSSRRARRGIKGGF